MEIPVWLHFFLKTLGSELPLHLETSIDLLLVGGCGGGGGGLEQQNVTFHFSLKILALCSFSLMHNSVFKKTQI